MRTKPETILAIDPGLRDLGYAVITGSELRHYGVLALRHLPSAERLGRVRTKLIEWIGTFQPDGLVLELIPRRALDQKAGLPALGRLLRRMAAASGLEAATYSARTVRRTLLGNGWARKPEVMKRVVGIFPELRVYRGQDRKWKDAHWQNMIDAIALALHHQSQVRPPSRGR